MLLRHDDEHHGGRLRTIRDIVEIVAIIAAGIWAFYTFIYETRILPAFTEPQANISETFEKVSEHNGLIGVRLVTTIKNVGTVRTNFLAFFVTVGGERVVPAQVRGKTKIDKFNYTLRSDYQTSQMVPVFMRGFITDHGDKESGAGLSLEPGEETRDEDLFYVKAGQFDILRAYVLARYTHSDTITPTQVEFRKDGLLDFANRHSVEVHQVQNFPASLDLSR
jgi:hypothetical protein